MVWVAHPITALSRDAEETPTHFTQTNDDKNVPCIKTVNSVSLLESRLSELGRVPANVIVEGNCFFRAVSYKLYNRFCIIVYAFLEFSIYCITLSCI